MSISNFTMLSEKQRQIVNTPADSHLLVFAGPGTGKTHILLNRLVYLSQSEALDPMTDILVLSFSRAAVAEIRNRLSAIVAEGAPDDLRFLNIRTFDSFATRLLVASEDELDLSKLDYDGRIALAVQKLSVPESEASERFTSFRHIFVDEIQDLVGVRAQLVLLLLERVSGGFTLLGDPAQGIYDYLVRQTRIGPDSIDFLSGIQKRWGNDLIIHDLDHNYRTQSPVSGIVQKVRPMLLQDEPDGEKVFKTLYEILGEIPGAGSIHAPDPSAVSNFGGRVALLCRTNVDVFCASSKLIEHGFRCSVPPRVDDKGLPVWIGRIFSNWQQNNISFRFFEQRWEQLIGNDYNSDMRRAWHNLKVIEGQDRESLDIETLRLRFRRGVDWVFDSEAETMEDGILVTTIHQSKGREYNRVLIMPPDSRMTHNPEEILEEARILYVAATRAKDTLLRIDRTGLAIIQRSIMPSGRERFIGQNPDGAFLIEIGPEDIDIKSYVGQSLFPTSKMASAAQELIWHKLPTGTRVIVIPQLTGKDIRFVLARRNPNSGRPVPLAVMNEDFKEDLTGFLQRNKERTRVGYLNQMEGVIVFERRTIVFPPFTEGLHESWANSGFCLGLGIRGLLVVG